MKKYTLKYWQDIARKEESKYSAEISKINRKPKGMRERLGATPGTGRKKADTTKIGAASTKMGKII